MNLKENIKSKLKSNFSSIEKLEKAKAIAKQSKTIEEFLNYNWDILAFGYDDEDIIELKPEEIKIIWNNDLENAKYKIDNELKFGKHFKIPLHKLPPVEVDFNGKEFTLQDGHHRWYLAYKLGKKLKAKIKLTANPFLFIGIENPEQFYREFHKEIKEEFSVGKYKTFSDLKSDDLINIARWGLLNDFDSSGAWDCANWKEEKIDKAIDCAVEDFENLLKTNFPDGFKNAPPIK